jgi:hypothetical protein
MARLKIALGVAGNFLLRRTRSCLVGTVMLLRHTLGDEIFVGAYGHTPLLFGRILGVSSASFPRLVTSV